MKNISNNRYLNIAVGPQPLKVCLRIVASGLGFLMVFGSMGCSSLAYLDDPGADGGDAGTDAGADAGSACAEPNPQGCVLAGCPTGQVCDQSISACRASSCSCDAANKRWSCIDDCNAGACRPIAPDGKEILFEITFQSDTPGVERRFVLQSDGGSSGGPAWLSVRDSQTGAKQWLGGSCAMCSCSACGESCPVCGMGQSFVESIGSGGTVSFAWDAITHPRTRCSEGSSCVDQVGLAPGDYVATFCTAGEATGEGAGQQLLGPLQCEEIPFTWMGSPRVVTDAICACG